MMCATYTNPDLQKDCWEGLSQANEVTNLLAWNFQEECNHAGVNIPKSRHDSKLAANSGL